MELDWIVFIFSCLIVLARPPSPPGVHDGPTRVILSLHSAEVDPVNPNTQTVMSCSLPSATVCRDVVKLTWRRGWCRCCLAVGGQVFASCGRRTEEGNPSDTETACMSFLVSLSMLSRRGYGLPRPPLLPGPCGCFLFLLVSRMWEENGWTPAVCWRRCCFLKGYH